MIHKIKITRTTKIFIACALFSIYFGIIVNIINTGSGITFTKLTISYTDDNNNNNNRSNENRCKENK